MWRGEEGSGGLSVGGKSLEPPARSPLFHLSSHLLGGGLVDSWLRSELVNTESGVFVTD